MRSFVAAMRLGTLVRARGAVSLFRDRRQLTLSFARVVADPNEDVLFWLQASQVRLRICLPASVCFEIWVRAA